MTEMSDEFKVRMSYDVMFMMPRFLELIRVRVCVLCVGQCQSLFCASDTGQDAGRKPGDVDGTFNKRLVFWITFTKLPLSAVLLQATGLTRKDLEKPQVRLSLLSCVV